MGTVRRRLPCVLWLSDNSNVKGVIFPPVWSHVKKDTAEKALLLTTIYALVEGGRKRAINKYAG